MKHSPARVVFCPCLHRCCPCVPQVHLHPLIISVKNCCSSMKAAGGGGGSIWIKLDLSVALKVRRLFMSRWERACTRVCDGERRDSLDSPETFLYESSHLFEAKKGPRSASHFKYTFITSAFSPLHTACRVAGH